MIERLFFAASETQWKTFPFARNAWDGGPLVVAARALFVLGLLLAVCLFLRFLFGPKGKWRDPGLETIQEANARRAKEKADQEADKAQNAPGQAHANPPPKNGP